MEMYSIAPQVGPSNKAASQKYDVRPASKPNNRCANQL